MSASPLRRFSTTHVVVCCPAVVGNLMVTSDPDGAISSGLARDFASRLRREAGTSREQQEELAYRLVVGRPPGAEESRLALAFLETGPLEDFALALCSSNAFLYDD